MSGNGIGRVDTHAHVVPPEYRDWLLQQKNYRGPDIGWSREEALDMYARNGIDTGILSVSTPGARLPFSEDVAGTRRCVRAVNEFCGEIVRDDPGHFGFFATLALPDIDGSVAEAQYAFDDLNADGVVLMTNTDGVYLGSAEWDPLLECLNERAAVVFVHPTAPVGPSLPGIPSAVVDFVAETVRSAVSLATNGSLRRYPRINFILSHGGGFLPYVAQRIAHMTYRGEPMESALAELRRFYVDTALTGSYGLPSLLAFADPTHLLFGTDWPFAPADDAAAFIDELDQYPLTPAQSVAINRGNAETLFPRLRRGAAS